jgi:hypothetical protein
MAESFKSKRAEFKKGEQKEFIIKSKKELGLTWQEFGKLVNISTRNLIDWKNEKISMSLSAVKIICKKMGCKMPADIVIKDPYWYVKKGALAGGKATYGKYHHIGGDEKIRKEKWREWWEREGKFKTNDILEPLPFKKPKFSEELAEFVGIMLGDGGITKNQIKVTLHCVDDAEYSKYVMKLIAKLFGVTPGKHKKKDCLVFNIEVSRVNLVKFCVDKLGLKIGNKVKQQVDIPDWIKKDSKYKIACLRGLVDTDGCLVIHKYRSKGKEYCYKKIGFTSRSYPLLKSAGVILKEFQIKHRIMKNNFDIRIEAKKDVEKYFKIVGTNNSKHLNRYKK